ncbi:hypothetical protein [Streptomyces sp. NBC_00057]|uniref:hypothetical protein n=1 Tax=Streptomyces sp. NBC_00057 TaxID=2975634 RepID=UPI00325308E3
MSRQQPGSQHNIGTGGTGGGPGIGQIIGNPLFIGTSSRERDHRSLVWNWVPSALVFLSLVIALAREPEGPRAQFLPVYAVLLVSFLIAFLRATVGVDWSRAARAAVSWVSVVIAVLGCLAMEDLREHGEVDVMGRITLTPSKNLTDGEQFVVVIKDGPPRGRLRLALDADEARGAGDVQRCRPDTRFVLPGPDGGTDDASGLNTRHELPVRDTPARFSITLRTGEDCRMDVSAAEAVLHD